MIIGCFALVEPFAGMARQFQAIREMGIDDADLTDNHDGASLGAEAGFVASVSQSVQVSRLLGADVRLPQHSLFGLSILSIKRGD
jgi:hypothetical protein